MVNVLDEFMNPWVNIIDDLHEKVEQTWLVDIDFTDVS
jgi:hypothetical protein